MAHLNPSSSQSKTPSSPKKSPDKSKHTPKSPMSSKSELGGKRLVAGGLPKEQEDEDAVTILAAVADFTARNGSNPTPATLKPVHEALKGKLHHGDITADQLYNKFRILKQRYHRALDLGVGPTPFDRTFFDLSVRAWGDPKRRKGNPQPSKQIDEEIMNSSAKKRKLVAEKKESDDADRMEDDDGGAASKFKFLTDRSRKYWKMLGMSMLDLELGLKFMDKSKAVVLESKWRNFFKEEIKIGSKHHDVQKDVLAALANVG